MQSRVHTTTTITSRVQVCVHDDDDHSSSCGMQSRVHTTITIMHSCWAEAPIKIARMTLTIKLDGNWSSFQLANSAPPLSVTDSAIAPSARMTREVLGTSEKQSIVSAGESYSRAN